MKYFYDQGNVKIRSASFWDVKQMRDNLRESDRMEVAASHGYTGSQALTKAFAESAVCLTVLYKLKPVAMFGVVADPEMKNVGSIWFLATDDLKKMWVTFLKLTPASIEQMMTVRPILYNYVDERNAASIRWLQWAGANMAGPKPYGMLGLPFRFFTFERVPASVLKGNGIV